MVKYVKLEDVITCIIFQVIGKDLTCKELREIINGLPIKKIKEEKSAIDLIYPVGSIFISQIDEDPNDLFEGTIWLNKWETVWERVC